MLNQRYPKNRKEPAPLSAHSSSLRPQNLQICSAAKARLDGGKYSWISEPRNAGRSPALRQSREPLLPRSIFTYFRPAAVLPAPAFSTAYSWPHTLIVLQARIREPWHLAMPKSAAAPTIQALCARRAGAVIPTEFTRSRLFENGLKPSCRGHVPKRSHT